MANKHQAHSLKFVTVGNPAAPNTFSRRAYHKCLILQIVLTPYCLCTTEKYGKPHRNSSSEITLTSSPWRKGAQCKLGCGTYGIWQQHMSNSAWCHNQVGLYSWISWYILRYVSKKHRQTVCLSESILEHLNTAQGTQILILVLLFFELQSEMQVAQCETENFFNLS
jgi:hypothetical protein